VTTRPTKGAENALQWSIEDGVLDASKLEGVDAVVHLAGLAAHAVCLCLKSSAAGESISSIGLGGWSEEAKQKITESRRKGTQLVVRTINSLTRKPKVDRAHAYLRSGM
jgi:NAD dependent epimerase/dehydratase family enzyme